MGEVGMQKFKKQIKPKFTKIWFTGNRNQTKCTAVKRIAFTLAEILITLAVIGIVAVLTIPTLVNKYQERVRVTQLKKVYNNLQQAYQLATIEHGSADKWGLTNTASNAADGTVVIDNSSMAMVCEYLGKYLKKSTAKSVTFDEILSVDGRKYTWDVQHITINEEQPTSMLLVDGTYVSMGWMYNNCNKFGVNACGDIAVYLPGKKQKLGVTYFYFWLTPKGIVPQGLRGVTSVPFPELCDVENSNNIPSTDQGRACTAWVIEKGNMEYLRCNDLSWDGKDRCN